MTAESAALGAAVNSPVCRPVSCSLFTFQTQHIPFLIVTCSARFRRSCSYLGLTLSAEGIPWQIQSLGDRNRTCFHRRTPRSYSLRPSALPRLLFQLPSSVTASSQPQRGRLRADPPAAQQGELSDPGGGTSGHTCFWRRRRFFNLQNILLSLQKILNY